MKKGQLQIHETILVLFIFIVILILGLVVFYRYNEQSLKNDIFEIELSKFNAMLSTFPQSPEIRCSFLGQDISCVDSYKLISFKKLIEEKNSYYTGVFGYKNITVYLVYPEKNKNNCNMNNIKNCGVWNLYLKKPRNYKNKLVINTPVSLYLSDKDSYGIGQMVIEWYQ